MASFYEKLTLSSHETSKSNDHHHGSRILMLILCSDTKKEYGEMMNVLRRLYKAVPNLDVYFYMYASTQADNIMIRGDDHDIISIKGHETLVPGVLAKTLDVFAFFLSPTTSPKPMHDYKYVFRTNISTIVDVPLFRALFHNDSIDYGAPRSIVLTKDYRDELSGIGDSRYAGIRYGVGTCIILSPRVIEIMLRHRHLVDMSVVDDVSIGVFMQRHLPQITLKAFPEKYWMVPNLQRSGGGGMHKLRLEVRRGRRLGRTVFYRNKNANRAVDVTQMGIVADVLRNDFYT